MCYVLLRLCVCSVYMRSPNWHEDFWLTIRNNQVSLNQWSDHCPENFLPMWLIVEAEIAKVQYFVQMAQERVGRQSGETSSCCYGCSECQYCCFDLEG